MATAANNDKPKTVTVRADDPRLVRPLDKVLVDSEEAHTDNVAMVSRTKDGKPDQAPGFTILDAVPDHEKVKAENELNKNNDA